MATTLAKLLAGEGALETEAGGAGAPARAEFGDVEDEIGRVAVDQVPGIAEELVMDVAGKALRADHDDLLLAADRHAQQRVEADEMVDMEVGDEDVADPQQVARGERAQVAEIEQQRLTPMQHLDEQARIAEPVVDEAGMEIGPHG